VRERPDFFARRDGEMVEAYGGYVFDWKNPELRDWYFDRAERFLEATGADGFRVDLAPDTSGYHFKELRDRLYAKGKKIMLMAEMPAERRETFDLDQLGVNGWTEPPKYGDKEALAEQKERFGSMHDSTFFFRENMVEAIKTGTGIGRPQLQQQGEGGLYRFYSVSPLFHDGHRPFVRGNRVRFGYLLFSPFIPIWWIGEEWNNPHDKIVPGAMFFNRIDWAAKDEPENHAFFEDVKRMIRVRRSFPEIFERFPPQVRDANIEKLTTLRDGEPNPLQAYIRHDENRAILVVPNYESPKDEPSEFEVTVPWEAWGADRSGTLRLVDLMEGRELGRASAEGANRFTVEIEPEHLGVYLLEMKEN
jgi:1,4-alpha-glucan branching enzyme